MQGLSAAAQDTVTRGKAQRSAPAPSAPVDRSTILAEERTRLALRRAFLATERTLMAWVRTSLSMISFGFTIVKFFEYLAEERKMTLVGLFGRAWAPATLGLMLIAIGTFSLVAAIVEHRRSLREPRSGPPRRMWFTMDALARLG